MLSVFRIGLVLPVMGFTAFSPEKKKGQSVVLEKQTKESSFSSGRVSVVVYVPALLAAPVGFGVFKFRFPLCL